MQHMERMIVELQARKKELDKENGQHKLKSTRSMSGRLTHALKMKMEKWKKLEEENGQLIKRARQYKEEKYQLLSHTDQCKKDNDLLKEKLATVEGKVKEMEETAVELQAQKRQLEEENGQHKLKLTGSVAGKLDDTHAMKSKIEDLQAQKTELEEENGQLKETLATVEQKIADM
jgi:chromosome segregation ATPase